MVSNDKERKKLVLFTLSELPMIQGLKKSDFKTGEAPTKLA